MMCYQRFENQESLKKEVYYNMHTCSQYLDWRW
jgi:hypothetical protein